MAEPILFTPGQSVGQGDWDALFAQHGGFKSVQVRQPTKEEQAAADDRGDDLTQAPIYRYYLGDGSYVEARTAPNGADYQVVDYKPSQAFTSAQTRAQTQAAKPQKSEAEQRQEAAQATTAETAAARAVREEAERKRNRELPKDQDPRDETDAQRADRAAATIKQQGDDARRADADRRAEADRNKPTVKIEKDASGQYVSIQTFPDGRAPVVTKIDGIRGDPATIKGPDGITYERQPDGTYKPAQGIPNPNTPEPEGAPQPSFTVGDAAADLQKYQQRLNAEMRKPGATLTAARADQLLEARRKLWQIALDEQTGIVNAQQSAYRDQVAQRRDTLQDQQNRRTSATSIANQTEGDYAGLMDKMGANPGGASIAQAIAEARFNAGAFVDSMSGGGVPEIKMGPAYAQTAGMQLNPRAGSPVPTIPLPGAPTPTANALGVGAVGNQPAPTGAPPAPAAPAFRPMPVAPAPVQAAPPVPQQARDDWRTQQQPAPTPAAPAQDSSFVFAPGPRPPAYPVNVQQPDMSDPAHVSMAPAPWFLAGSSNGRAYDPSPAIASLVADPNIDNEMLRQAVAMEYPGYDIDALLGRRSVA